MVFSPLLLVVLLCYFPVFSDLPSFIMFYVLVHFFYVLIVVPVNEIECFLCERHQNLRQQEIVEQVVDAKPLKYYRILLKRNRSVVLCTRRYR